MAENNRATPKDIFISYGRQQNVDEFVDKVSAEIEKAGWSTFVDRKDITSGDSIIEEVASGILDCQAVVAVITLKYLNSKWCLTELINAFVGKKIIFPIILGDRIPEQEMRKTKYGSSVSMIITEYLYTQFKTATYEQGPMKQLILGISKKKLGQKKNGEEEVDAGIPAPIQQSVIHVPDSVRLEVFDPMVGNIAKIVEEVMDAIPNRKIHRLKMAILFRHPDLRSEFDKAKTRSDIAFLVRCQCTVTNYGLLTYLSETLKIAKVSSAISSYDTEYKVLKEKLLNEEFCKMVEAEAKLVKSQPLSSRSICLKVKWARNKAMLQDFQELMQCIFGHLAGYIFLEAVNEGCMTFLLYAPAELQEELERMSSERVEQAKQCGVVLITVSDKTILDVVDEQVKTLKEVQLGQGEEETSPKGDPKKIMAKQLFLSYGREEEVKPFVKQLKHDLENSGFTVWLDVEDIPAGCNWRDAIASALHNCEGLIAVITDKYIKSHFCTSELHMVDTGRTSVFPVIFEDVNFEQSKKSKGVKFVIGKINWSFFRPGVDNYDESLQKLVQGMTGHGIKPNAVVRDDAVEDTDTPGLDNAKCKGSKGDSKKNQCTSSHLCKIATRIVTWESIAIEFGIEAAQVVTIKQKYQGDYESQKQEMLLEWKGKQKGDASYEKLMKIFKYLGNLQMVHYIECLVLGTEE